MEAHRVDRFAAALQKALERWAACGIKSKQIRGLCDAVRKTLLKWCGKSLKQIRIEKLCEAIAKTASKWIVRPRITTDHIDRLCDDVYQSLSNAIQAQIRQLTARDPLETEIEAHETFGIERSLHFTGRADMLRDIEHYIRGSDRNPLVVQGGIRHWKVGSNGPCRATSRIESWRRRGLFFVSSVPPPVPQTRELYSRTFAGKFPSLTVLMNPAFLRITSSW